MQPLPSAKQSPRISDGVIYWYENDTFDIDLQFELVTSSGEPIEITAFDEIKIIFRNSSDKVIKEFSFTGIEDNTIKLVINSAVSAMFPKGIYTYDICYKSDGRTTIANDNKVVVQ